MKQAARQDDGRRSYPKIRCPLCGGRAVDARNAALSRAIELVSFASSDHEYVIICPQCKKPIGVRLRAVRESVLQAGM